MALKVGIQLYSVRDEMKKDPAYQNLDRTCPICGAKLIIKRGKNGSFYGCENFPDCKFTKSM